MFSPHPSPINNTLCMTLAFLQRHDPNVDADQAAMIMNMFILPQALRN